MARRFRRRRNSRTFQIFLFVPCCWSSNRELGGRFCLSPPLLSAFFQPSPDNPWIVSEDRVAHDSEGRRHAATEHGRGIRSRDHLSRYSCHPSHHMAVYPIPFYPWQPGLIEWHMIVRGEDMQRRNMVVVFVAGTIYHGIAVIRLIIWQFIQSPFILGSLVSLPDPFGGKRSSDNDGKFHLIATIYFHYVTLLESDLSWIWSVQRFCLGRSRQDDGRMQANRRLRDSKCWNANSSKTGRSVFPPCHTPFPKDNIPGCSATVPLESPRYISRRYPADSRLPPSSFCGKEHPGASVSLPPPKL